MSLFAELNAQARTVSAHLQAMSTIGKNIGNLKSDHYSREVTHTGSAGSVDMGSFKQGLGAHITGIEQIKDSFLDKQMIREISKKNSLLIQDNLNKTLELQLNENVKRIGDPVSMSNVGAEALNSSGLSRFLDDFFNVFHELSGSPIDPSQRQVLIEKTKQLCDKFHELSVSFSQMKEDINTQRTNDLGVINGLLDKISIINENIMNSGGNKSLGLDFDYKNEREQYLEELAKYISFETEEIMPENGIGSPLLSIKLITNGSDKNEVLSGSTIKEEFMYDKDNDTYVLKNSLGKITPVSFLAGKLSGYSSFTQGTIQPLEDDLNSLAKQLIVSVNTAYGADFFDSNPDFFNTSGIQLNPLLTSKNLLTSKIEDGGNDILLNIADLSKKSFEKPFDLIDGTVGDAYRHTLVSLGQKMNSISSSLKASLKAEENIKSRRESIRGVSLDEELAQLDITQRALSGSLAFAQVVRECLDEVINMARRH